MKTALLPDEKILREAVASLERGAEAVGGHLYLTTARLVFEPRKFNIQSAPAVLDLSNVRFVRPSWTRAFGLVPTYPNSLSVFLANRSEYRFILWRRKEWRRAIDAQRGVVASAHQAAQSSRSELAAAPSASNSLVAAPLAPQDMEALIAAERAKLDAAPPAVPDPGSSSEKSVWSWIGVASFVLTTILFILRFIDFGSSVPACGDKETIQLLRKAILGANPAQLKLNFDEKSIVTIDDIDNGRGHLCRINVSGLLGSISLQYTAELNDKGDEILVQVQN